MSRSSSTVELNLFPFLSVLVAVIGILMLNLVSVISGRVVGLQQQTAADAASSGAPPGPATPRAALDDRQYRELEQQLHQMASQVAKNKAICRDLEERVKSLDILIETRGDEAALGWSGPEDAFAGLSLGAPVEVRTVPDPTRSDRRTPIPLEVSADGYLVHHQGKREPLPSLPQDPKPMRQFLERLDRDRNRSYLLVLLRPDGVVNYKLLRAFLTSEFGETVEVDRVQQRASRIAMGVEPFDRDWLLISDTP